MIVMLINFNILAGKREAKQSGSEAKKALIFTNHPWRRFELY